MNFLKRLSLVPTGLRYKLTLAFCLMSIIPLLVSAYLARDYVFNIFVSILERDTVSPISMDIISISWVLFFCLALAFLGLILAKQMIEPVIEMALQAKLIANGDINHRITVKSEDEVGELGRSINQITLRIKENIEELKSYGERTKAINTEIHAKLLALSSLLQVGENIAAAAQLEQIMDLIMEKVMHILDGEYAILFIAKTAAPNIMEVNIANNVRSDELSRLEIRVGEGILGSALKSGKVVCADSKSKFSKQAEDFKELYGVKNFAAFPLISRNRPIGLLFVANSNEDYEFKSDDVEVIKIFAKQATIAYENNALSKKAKELSIKDDLTDLYNEKYIANRLDEEINRGILYQRPCSYLMFNIDNFDRFREKNGELATENALKSIASVLKGSVTQIERAARLSGDEFALLLPEKNKKEAYKIASEVRKKVEDLDLKIEKEDRLTISGGVSENPLDGATAKELMDKAADSASKAKSQGKNKIV